MALSRRGPETEGVEPMAAGDGAWRMGKVTAMEVNLDFSRSHRRTRPGKIQRRSFSHEARRRQRSDVYQIKSDSGDDDGDNNKKKVPRILHRRC